MVSCDNGAKCSNEKKKIRFVKQRGSFSPQLFILLMDEMWKMCKRRFTRVVFGFWNLTLLLVKPCW